MKKIYFNNWTIEVQNYVFTDQQVYENGLRIEPVNAILIQQQLLQSMTMQNVSIIHFDKNNNIDRITMIYKNEIERLVTRVDKVAIGYICVRRVHNDLIQIMVIVNISIQRVFWDNDYNHRWYSQIVSHMASKISIRNKQVNR